MWPSAVVVSSVVIFSGQRSADGSEKRESVGGVKLS